MSNSNAAAIRRRTNIQQNVPVSNSFQPQSQQQMQQQMQQQQQQQKSQSTNSNVNSPGLTLPQIIALVDKRLINLETFARETKTTKERELASPSPSLLPPSKSPSTASSAPAPAQDPNNPFVTEVELNTVIDEFNHRFEVLATEINEIKDMLLKLQTYTMDVNKLLLDERIHILSDVSSSSNTNINTEKFEISSSILENYDQSTNSSVDLRDLAKKELSTDDEETELVLNSTDA